MAARPGRARRDAQSGAWTSLRSGRILRLDPMADMDLHAEMTRITDNARRMLAELPDGVLLVAAAKGRGAREVLAAAEGGVTCIGHNYVQEAARQRSLVDLPLSWHLIGHLQRNKAAPAVELFDVIETVDSMKLALELDRRCAAQGRCLRVLIEVNSARETGKSGAMPQDTLDLAAGVAALGNLRLTGLMTLGPAGGCEAEIRGSFRIARALCERVRELPGMKDRRLELSMGMSDSYRMAVEEGATMVRIGTALFGPRRPASG